MKSFLTKLGFFSLYSAVVYVVLIVAFGLLIPRSYTTNLKYMLGGNGNMYTRLEQVKDVKNVDILVLGSSHAYRGYDPRIFAKHGLTMFNLGSSAQSMIETEALLRIYLDQVKPKYVIYDIYPLFLGSDGVESGLDIISNAGVNRHILNMTFELNNITVYNTFIYSVFRQIAGLNKKFKEADTKGYDSYVSGGFVQSFEVAANNTNTSVKPFKYKFSDVQIAALKRIANMFKEHNIPFVLLQAPLPVNRYAKITNNSSVDSLLSSIGTYHNFNKVITIPDSLFADDSHLNQWGVNKYNAAVIKQLKLVKNNTAVITDDNRQSK